MKMTLIEPAMIKKPSGLSEKPIFCFQPLALGVLAGLTPPYVEVEVIDDRFETIDYTSRRDLVAISVRTFNARRAYQIADEFRRGGTPVILGGHHVSLLPEEAGQHADAVFVGEAEMLWAKVLEDACQGQLQHIYQGGREAHYPPFQVNRAVLKNKKYLPAGLVETARGCPYNCSFCSVTTFFGHTFRRRPVGQLVDEIRSTNQKTILFVDDNIIGEVESAKELLTALIPLKIRWISQASISMTHDLELMELMRRSGCAGVLVGIESLFVDNLKDIRKGWNTARQDYVQSLQIAREHGIALVGSFIVGLTTTPMNRWMPHLSLPSGKKCSRSFSIYSSHFLPRISTSSSNTKVACATKNGGWMTGTAMDRRSFSPIIFQQRESKVNAWICTANFMGQSPSPAVCSNYTQICKTPGMRWFTWQSTYLAMRKKSHALVKSWGSSLIIWLVEYQIVKMYNELALHPSTAI
jgi:hypothetical protein